MLATSGDRDDPFKLSFSKQGLPSTFDPPGFSVGGPHIRSWGKNRQCRASDSDNFAFSLPREIFDLCWQKDLPLLKRKFSTLPEKYICSASSEIWILYPEKYTNLPPSRQVLFIWQKAPGVYKSLWIFAIFHHSSIYSVTSDVGYPSLGEQTTLHTRLKFFGGRLYFNCQTLIGKF